MDSMTPSIQSTGDTSRESSRKKRRKSEVEETETRRIAHQQGKRGTKRWRTEREQQIYSSKLVEALRRIRRNTSSDATAGKVSGMREIRETADRVLATSARGTTRWSRAILASRIRARLKKHKKANVTGKSQLRNPGARGEKPRKLPVVERKVKVLSRLVPGCRKLSFPSLLEEATDYIAALEMQVRAMTALAELLAAAPQPSSS